MKSANSNLNLVGYQPRKTLCSPGVEVPVDSNTSRDVCPSLCSILCSSLCLSLCVSFCYRNSPSLYWSEAGSRSWVQTAKHVYSDPIHYRSAFSTYFSRMQFFVRDGLYTPVFLWDSLALSLVFHLRRPIWQHLICPCCLFVACGLSTVCLALVGFLGSLAI